MFRVKLLLVSAVCLPIIAAALQPVAAATAHNSQTGAQTKNSYEGHRPYMGMRRMHHRYSHYRYRHCG